MSNDGFPRGWEEHRADQIEWFAKNTTPDQRFEWLCEMIELFGDQIPKIKEAHEWHAAQKKLAEESVSDLPAS